MTNKMTNKLLGQKILPLFLLLALVSGIFSFTYPLHAAEKENSDLHFVGDREIPKKFDYDALEDNFEALQTITANVQEFSKAIQELIEDDDPVYSPLSLYLALAALRPGLTGESLTKFDAVMNPTGISDADFVAGLHLIYSMGAETAGIVQEEEAVEGNDPDEAAKEEKDEVEKDEKHQAEKEEKEEAKNKGRDKDKTKDKAKEKFIPWLSESFVIGAKNKDLTFNQDYVEALNRMGMKAALADLSKKPAFTEINKMVSDLTHELIDPLFTDKQIEEKVEEDLLLLLMNIIYFKGNWETEFDPDKTEIKTFHGVDAETEVPMMQNTFETLYLATDVYQAIQLPYETGGTMYLVLPKHDCSRAEAMAMAEEAKASEEWENCEVKLSLPRFSQELDLDLIEVLEKLDLDFLTCLPKEDVTIFAEKEDMAVSNIIQKVKFKLDEEGTEAAAVTVMGIAEMSAMPEKPKKVEMTVDHPFVYQVVDFDLPLFVGAVANLPDVEEELKSSRLGYHRLCNLPDAVADLSDVEGGLTD